MTPAWGRVAVVVVLIVTVALNVVVLVGGSKHHPVATALAPASLILEFTLRFALMVRYRDRRY